MPESAPGHFAEMASSTCGMDDMAAAASLSKDGHIMRVAVDPDFDFARHFKVFESTIRGMLK